MTCLASFITLCLASLIILGSALTRLHPLRPVCSYSTFSYNFAYSSSTRNGVTKVCFATSTASSSYSNTCNATDLSNVQISISE